MGSLDPVGPRYGQASLAEVMPSVLAVLGVPGEFDALGLRGPLDGVRRIAVLLIDGLGWHQLGLASAQGTTIAEVVGGRYGSARALTCGFPSTTPTSLVTLGTGAPPGAHGVLGFNLRIPGTDRVLNHIQWANDPEPQSWQPVRTTFDRAIAAGVNAAVVSRAEYEGTGLSVSAYGTPDYYRAGNVDAIASELLAALKVTPIVYGYHPDLDRAGHESGVDSPAWQAAAAEVDRLITQIASGLPSDGALLVIADHGMIDVPTTGRFDIDADSRLRAGVAVVAGEARARYLHVEPGALDDVLATWSAVLGRHAWVATREEAIATGWFGVVPERHAARLGDVVVVCRERSAVLATRHEPPSVARFIGFHGGNTAAEMRIPLLILR
jgi:hypothetical protein